MKNPSEEPEPPQHPTYVSFDWKSLGWALGACAVAVIVAILFIGVG